MCVHATNLDPQAPIPKSSVNPNNLVEVVGAVSGELDRMQTLVEKEVLAGGDLTLMLWKFAHCDICLHPR